MRLTWLAMGLAVLTKGLVGIAIPGGMEYFFDELAAAQEAGSLDDAEHRRISLKYGIEWLE